MSLFYFDTMMFIYWLEAHPTNTPPVEQIHRKMKARGDKRCTSVFTIGEILAGAHKSGRLTEAQPIKEFFGGGEVRVLQFGTDAAERYAFLRASHNLSPAMRFISPPPQSLMSMFS